MTRHDAAAAQILRRVRALADEEARRGDPIGFAALQWVATEAEELRAALKRVVMAGSAEEARSIAAAALAARAGER